MASARSALAARLDQLEAGAAHTATVAMR